MHSSGDYLETEVRLQALILQAQSANKSGIRLEEHYPSQQIRLESSFAMSFQHKFIRLNELPSVLQNRGGDFSQTRIREALDILGVNLYYLFTDGSIIAMDEIFFHPHCNIVNPELLPVVRGVYDTTVDLKLFYWSSPSISFPLKYGDIEYVILKIIKNSQKLVVNQRLELIIAFSEMIQKSNLLEAATNKILKFEFFTPEKSADRVKLQLVWQSQEAESKNVLGAGTLKLKLGDETNLSFKAFDWIPGENKIFFHPLASFLNDFYQFLKNLSPGLEVTQNGQITIPHFIREIPLASHETIQVVTAYLREKQKTFPFLQISWDYKVQAYKKEDSTFQLFISKANEVSMAIKTNDFTVFNFGFLAHHICQGFFHGFKFLFDDNAISDRRGANRTRDIKFVKHTGLYAMYVYEILKYVLAPNDEKKLTVEAFFEKLSISLGRAILLSEGIRAEENFRHLISKNIYNTLHLNFLRILDEVSDGSLSVFTEDKEVRFEDVKLEWCRLYFTILEDLLIQTDGEIFKKSRSNYFPFTRELTNESAWELSTNKDIESISINERIAKYPLWSESLKKFTRVQSLFALTEHRWQLYINGKPLETLDTADFNWKFNLSEESANPNMTNQKMDWFSLHPKFFLKGKELDVDAAIEFTQGGWLEYDGKVYVLKSKEMPSVKALEKFWARIAKSKDDVTKSKSKVSKLFSIPKSATLELLALRALGVAIEGGEEWRVVCEFYDSLSSGPREPTLSPEIQGELKPYQKKGLRWLQDIYTLRLGGILADDMGLGKTLQTLSFLECLREQNDLGNVLIIVPTSLVYNWRTESQKFTPKLPMLQFQSKDKETLSARLNDGKGSILIVTYGLLTEHEEFFKSHAWNVHVYDEAQNIKNIVTRRATIVRQINARFKLCLTGTPLENHLGEFYSLLDTAVSGSLGDYDEYKKTYITPMSIKKSDMDFLKARIRPLVLRRTKKEILKELPDKTVTIMKIPFSEEQRKIYRDVALSWNQKVKDSVKEMGEAKSQMIMLTALLRLRQVCSDPSSIPGVKFQEEPPKFGLLRDSLVNIVESGESAIVFTQFIPSLERILRILKQENIQAFSLDGRMTKTKREETLQGFNDFQGGAVLCMTLKTGGVGLNLTKASYVFHMEPWWNPAVENQATDRVHRIGQERHVQVYRYLMEESVEEKIEFLKERKSSHFQALFSDIETETDIKQTSSQLSQDDFEFLLS
jgi:SNF2 family DNA or RNA helicase